MRVLTFGWEFPPAKNGGLGVACYGLTRELLQNGVEVIFVLPKTQDIQGGAKFLFADQERLVKIRHTDVSLQPYQQASSLVNVIIGYDKTGKPIIRSRTIVEEAHRFAHQASIIAREEEFDVIHAHDWTSFLAGVAAKKASGKPLILHVHATSFDQAASENVDPEIARRRCTTHLRAGRHRRPHAAGQAAGGAPPARGAALRRRKPCRSQHRRPGRVHPHQRRRHPGAAGSRARVLDLARRPGERKVQVPSCLDG